MSLSRDGCMDVLSGGKNVNEAFAQSVSAHAKSYQNQVYLFCYADKRRILKYSSSAVGGSFDVFFLSEISMFYFYYKVDLRSISILRKHRST